MFFWCVIKDNTGTKIEKIINELGVESDNKYIKTGKDNEAIIEASETNLNIKKIMIKTKEEQIAAVGWIPIKIPSNVAIPLPPRNPVKTGNKCPITAAIPKVSWSSKIPSIEKGIKSKKAIKLTERKPFKTSKNKTGKPAFFPKTLNVFVAPAFPLPNSHTSIL